VVVRVRSVACGGGGGGGACEVGGMWWWWWCWCVRDRWHVVVVAHVWSMRPADGEIVLTTGLCVCVALGMRRMKLEFAKLRAMQEAREVQGQRAGSGGGSGSGDARRGHGRQTRDREPRGAAGSRPGGTSDSFAAGPRFQGPAGGFVNASTAAATVARPRSAPAALPAHGGRERGERGGGGAVGGRGGMFGGRRATSRATSSAMWQTRQAAMKAKTVVIRPGLTVRDLAKQMGHKTKAIIAKAADMGEVRAGPHAAGCNVSHSVPPLP